MKNRHFRLFSPFFVVFISFLISVQIISVQNSQAQWVQTNGPEGGHINSIVPVGNKLFIGTEAGIFVSTNNGLSWEAKNNGLQFYRVYTLFALDGIIFAGNEIGIYRSTDGGETWQRSHEDYTMNFTSDGSNLYATMGYDGVYMTTDKGESWINIGLDQTLVSVLVAKGNTLYAGTSNAVYYTTNRGKTWTISYNGMPSPSYIMALTIKDNILFASIANEGVYRSTNNGESWEESSDGLPDQYVQTFFVKNNLLYAGTHYGIFVSSNNGTSWSYTSSGINGLTISTMNSNNGILFAGTGNGIFYSNDGINWNETTNGIKIKSINHLVKHGSAIYAADYGDIYKTENNGSTWTKLDFMYSTISLLSHNDYLYVSSHIYNRIYRTSDGGSNWDYLTIEDDKYLLVYIIAAKDNYLFAGTDNGSIYRSSNNGQNWSITDNDFNGLKVNSIIINNNNIYAGASSSWGRYGQVFMSSNNGDSWNAIGDSIYYGVKILGSKEGTIYASSARNLYTFNSDGSNWNSIPSPEGIIQLIIKKNSFIASTGNGIYVSINKGLDWSVKNQGFINYEVLQPTVYAMLEDNGYLYASQEYASIWKRPMRELIGDDASVNPTDYVLKQNYPNPFNPVTNIEFSLPIAGNVKLDIYDITGKLVASLLDQDINTGTYNVTWNASNISSGIYFYKLSTKYFTQTKKMMLIK